jgi:four helix bundle protein
MERGYFTFERLEAYRVAREVLALFVENRAAFRGVGDVASQLGSALVSVAGNLAEGAGRESAADQRRCYVIARGSANEAAAMIDIASVLGKIAASEAMLSRLVRVVQMLNAMIRR